MSDRDNPIRVTFIRPPIPTTKFDWSACRDDYEPGRPVGFGPTAEEAVRDLLETEEWEAEGKQHG